MAPSDQPAVRVADQVAAPVREKEYGAKPEVPNPPRKVAIIVNHGMGQQVPFETLELVAKALWKKEPANTRQPIVTRMVRLGTQDKPEEKELPRAEVHLTRADGETIEAHLYEAYWAPLTEGKVSITQVISFLLGAGWSGIRNALSGDFRRWMFGDWQRAKIRRVPLIFSFDVTILLVLSLVIINAVVVTAAASHTLGGGGSWPAGDLTLFLTRDLLGVDFSLLSVALGTIGLPWLGRKIRYKGRLLSYPAWFFTFAGIGGLLLMGFAMGLHVVGWHIPAWFLWLAGAVGAASILVAIVVHMAGWHGAGGLFAFTAVGGLMMLALAAVLDVFGWPIFSAAIQQDLQLVALTSRPALTTLVWGIAIVGSALARNVIVEYVGDVTAYVAFHTVSVFWEVRKAILDLAFGVARAVYRARTDGDDGFLYDDVIVLGHSLGSVIAYDVLNGLLVEDKFSAKPLNVAGRTKLFLTFGSPLDKTAFILRTQQDINSAVRESYAAAKEPMIRSYDFRPQRWINIWSHSDWVSGSLEYYDAWWPAQTGRNKRVENYLDRDANAPLIAHTQYWTNDLFAEILYASATSGQQPAAVQPPQRLRTLRAFIWAQPVNPVNSAYWPV